MPFDPYEYKEEAERRDKAASPPPSQRLPDTDTPFYWQIPRGFARGLAGVASQAGELASGIPGVEALSRKADPFPTKAPATSSLKKFASTPGESWVEDLSKAAGEMAPTALIPGGMAEAVAIKLIGKLPFAMRTPAVLDRLKNALIAAEGSAGGAAGAALQPPGKGETTLGNMEAGALGGIGGSFLGRVSKNPMGGGNVPYYRHIRPKTVGEGIDAAVSFGAMEFAKHLGMHLDYPEQVVAFTSIYATLNKTGLLKELWPAFARNPGVAGAAAAQGKSLYDTGGGGTEETRKFDENYVPPGIPPIFHPDKDAKQ